MELLRTPEAYYTAIGKGNFTSKTVTTTSGEKYAFKVGYYYNRSGFVHFAQVTRLNDYEVIGNARAQYYNRTWERYTGQSVYRQAIARALKMNNLTQAQYDELYALLEN